MSWSDLGGWWLEEIAGDPAYETVVTPLLLEILAPESSDVYLDLGCGEGRVMRAVIESGSRVIGLDLNHHLARLTTPSLVGRLPTIPIADSMVDGAYAVLVLEHLADIDELFAETARVVRSGGVMAVVMNHPMWTAPGSMPVTDGEGEPLWRPGAYMDPGSSAVDAADSQVVFHHRSLADLLTLAAGAGWALEHMIERTHQDTVEVPEVPRLLGCRWRLLP